MNQPIQKLAANHDTASAQDANQTSEQSPVREASAHRSARAVLHLAPGMRGLYGQRASNKVPKA